MYNRPAVNVAMTFAEVFPVGLCATLHSAAALRKIREPGGMTELPGILGQGTVSTTLPNCLPSSR